MKKKWIFMPFLLIVMLLICEMHPVRAEVASLARYKQKDEELGKYIYCSLFTLDDSNSYAFCIERSRATPAAGSSTSDWIEVFNEDLRKVLYYGYGGPQNKGYTVVETSCAAAAANGDNETSIGRYILEEIQLLESPPENFRVWKVETNGGYSQDLAFFTTLTTGELELIKVSTDENYEYSLEGAVYGVFSDAECTNQIGELTTDAEGKSEVLELEEGTYYVRELIAPEGYLLNEEIIEVQVLVERTLTLTVSDEPIPTYVDMVIQKTNAIGEVLEGAVFELYADEECSLLIGTGSTDAGGQVVFQNLIQDKIYYLKEIKAPDGYILSETVNMVTANGEIVPVINEKIVVLPNTGSFCGFATNAFGVWCILKSLKRRN